MPARKYFFSSVKKGKIGDDGKISDGHISVKDYLTCKKNWDKFEMKYMGDYHDNYLKKDVLSWDVMLKMTGVKLEKISDTDKWFIEKWLRGGISYIVKRYTKANNK